MVTCQWRKPPEHQFDNQFVIVQVITLQGLNILIWESSPESQHFVPESSQSGRSEQSFPPLTAISLISLISPHFPVIGYNSTQFLAFVPFYHPLPLIIIITAPSGTFLAF